MQGPQSRLGLQGLGRARRPCTGIQGRDISWEDLSVRPQLGPCLVLTHLPSPLCLPRLQEHRSLCVQQVPRGNGAGPFNRECVTKGGKEETVKVSQVQAARVTAVNTGGRAWLVRVKPTGTGSQGSWVTGKMPSRNPCSSLSFLNGLARWARCGDRKPVRGPLLLSRSRRGCSAWVELHEPTVLKPEWLVNTQFVLHAQVYCGSSGVDFTPFPGQWLKLSLERPGLWQEEEERTRRAVFGPAASS